MKNTNKIFKQLKANPIAVEPLGLGTIPDLPKTFTFPEFQIGDTVLAVDYNKVGRVVFVEYVKNTWVYLVKVLDSGDEIDYQEHSLIIAPKGDNIRVNAAFGHIRKYERLDYVAYEDLSKQPKEKGDDAVLPKVYKVLSAKLTTIDLELIDAFDNGIIKNTGRKVQMLLPEKSLKVIGENAMKALLGVRLLKKQFKASLELLLWMEQGDEIVENVDKTLAKEVDEKLKNMGFEYNPHSRKFGKHIDENRYITAFHGKDKDIFTINSTRKYTTPFGENSMGMQFDFENESEFWDKIREYLPRTLRNDKLKIGFTTQFYTLWEVDGNYRHFLRNLSMNKDMALELAKDAGATDLHIYTDLKGMESIYYEDSVAKGLFDWQFPYGKLKGEDIRYSEDVWQLERIAKQGNQYAIDRLVELGNHTFHKREIVTKTFAENDMAADQAKSQEATRIQQALKKGFIEFVVTKNITNYDLEEDGNSDFIESNDTTIVSEEYGTITLKRVPIKMMSYNGFDYFLPLINGKATKIKNKKIRITIIGLDVDDRLLGTDLKILK